MPRPARSRPPVTNRAAPTRNRRRQLILDLWARTHIDWGFAAARLSTELKEQRWLGSHERREVFETIYGMVRQARRIDFALGAELGRLPAGSRRELARYLAFHVLEGALSVEAARVELGDVDWTAVATVDARIVRERDPAVRLGLTRSLPDWLARRLLEQYGGEADGLAAALNERAPLTLRTNTLKTTRDGLLSRLLSDGVEATATRYAPHGITLAQRIDVWSLEAFKEGWFEAQDEGSQLVAEMVAPPPRGVVVDACAGAGGKTLAIGAMMESRGRLLATDVDERKLEDLKKRARRAGLSSVQAVPTGPDVWPHEMAELYGKIDRLLIDAPCTGTGSLRRNPELRWRLRRRRSGLRGRAGATRGASL